MKSFDEEYPSLKGKEHIITEFNPGETPEEKIFTKNGIIKEKLTPEPSSFEGRTCHEEHMPYCGRMYGEETIQEHCKDNLKIKEAIDKIFPYDEELTSRIMKANNLALKKELGL